MLLAIDAGNTNTVFALIEGGEIRERWRLSTGYQRTGEEYQVWLTQLLAIHGWRPADVDGAIIASVVPQVVRPLTLLCTGTFGVEPLVVGAPGIELDVDVRVDSPQDVGADRLVNALAAHAAHEGPLVVVDFGTATTFDVVAADGAYLGGLICPGINLSLHALHQAAAKLPHIALAAPEDNRVTGKNTYEAMQSGIFWGYVSMLEGLVHRLRAEHSPDMTVIATGGLAPIFADHTDAIDLVEGDLTLTGLRLIHEKNTHKRSTE